MARRKPQTVRAAVDASDELAALMATARALADDIDGSDTRPTARSIAAKELRETFDKIRMLAPPAEKADRLDDISARRAQRRRRSAA